MQHAQLATQASQNTWRRSAFHALLHTRPYRDDDTSAADANGAGVDGDGLSDAAATTREGDWWESVDHFQDKLFVARGAADRSGDSADAGDTRDAASEAARKVWRWAKRSGLEYGDWADQRGLPGLSKEVKEWPAPKALQSLRATDARDVARELDFVSSFALAPKAMLDNTTEAAVALRRSSATAATDAGGDDDRGAASVSDDTASLVEDAAPPPSCAVRAMLAKGDTVQAASIAQNKWIDKANIEDVFAPTLDAPGAEQGDADVSDAGGSVIVCPYLECTHERDRFQRRVMRLLEVRWFVLSQ